MRLWVFFFVLQKLELAFPFQGCTVQYSLLLRTQRSQTCSYGSPPEVSYCLASVITSVLTSRSC